MASSQCFLSSLLSLEITKELTIAFVQKESQNDSRTWNGFGVKDLRQGNGTKEEIEW
jgi:hypothetical protein